MHATLICHVTVSLSMKHVKHRPGVILSEEKQTQAFVYILFGINMVSFPTVPLKCVTVCKPCTVTSGRELRMSFGLHMLLGISFRFLSDFCKLLYQLVSQS